MNRRTLFLTACVTLLLSAFGMSACSTRNPFIGFWRIDPVRTRDWTTANIGAPLPKLDNLGNSPDFSIRFSQNTVTFLEYAAATSMFPDSQYKYTVTARAGNTMTISMVGSDGRAKEEVFHLDDADRDEMWMPNPAFPTGPNNDIRIYFKRVTRPDQ